MIRKNKLNRSGESVRKRRVWGFRVDSIIIRSCRLAAAMMGVPVGQLVSFIIKCWFDENISLLGNAKAMKELGKILKGEQSLNKRNTRLQGRAAAQSPGEDDLANLKTKWSMRGISIETILRIKLMAFNKGMPIGKFIDVMAAREWEKAGNELAVPGLAQSARKLVHRALVGHG